MTYTVNCENTTFDLASTINNVGQILGNYTKWAGYNSSYENFKFSSFEVVSMLEYPYLMSAYCNPVDAEIE